MQSVVSGAHELEHMPTWKEDDYGECMDKFGTLTASVIQHSQSCQHLVEILCLGCKTVHSQTQTEKEYIIANKKIKKLTPD